jgi:hypothetical protein
MSISPPNGDSMPPKAQDQYSEAETLARREAALKRMLTTPPKPLKTMVAKPTGRVTNPKGRPVVTRAKD